MRSAAPALTLSALLAASGCGPTHGMVATQTGDLADSTDGSGAMMGDGPGAGVDLAFAGTLAHFAAGHLLLPPAAQPKGPYSTDENGDGVVDNQLHALVQLIATHLGSFPQQDEDSSISVDGDGVPLITLGTADASLTSDAGAFCRVLLAAPQMFPRLDGSGSFAVDPASRATRLGGPLLNHAFQSATPWSLTADAPVTLRLGFLRGVRQTFTLHGAHVEFTVGPGGLMSGQIDGVITAADIQAVLVPWLSAGLTRVASDAPCGSDCVAAKALDLNHDGKVATDEVTASFLAPALAPDVEMFTAGGAYAPSPANRNLDAWSIGVGFTAVKATYAEP